MTKAYPEFGRVTDLASAAGAAHAWLFDHALPFWGSIGHEGAERGACEHLRSDGTGADVAFKRMRVQARQIYVFSHAAVLGWPQGEALARSGYAFITRKGAAPDGGWVRLLSADGNEVLDPAIDLYDQAFVLLALAWFARAVHDDEPLRRARDTVAWLRRAMAAPSGGFFSVLPDESGPRLQNPHMHLLEAALALFETTGEPAYAAFAHELVALFRTRLFHRDTGTLGEVYDTDWSPAPGLAGSLVEPGHHYEWVWLLDRYERLTGASAWAEADRLFRFARQFGTDSQTGLVWDSVERHGEAREKSIRLWPQTEALKAHCTMARRDWGGADPIVQAVRNIGTIFLDGCPPGAWIDRFDAVGRPVSETIPTSSLYHLFLGFAELDALMAAEAPATARRQTTPTAP